LPQDIAEESTLVKAGSRAPSLVAIGNFDGVHRGHVDVLSRAAREAEARGAAALALTFDPPPAVVLGKKTPSALTPLERKVELIEALVPGIRVVVKAFDHALAESSPEQFVTEVLAGELGVVEVVVGRNFRFGKGRAGDLTTLSLLGEKLGFSARAMELVGDEKGTWSSTRVRQAIAAGDWDDVRGVLGRPHAISGVVVRGDQRGRTIGFPTANLADVDEVMPPNGVYAVLVDRLDRAQGPRALAKGVANIGLRPTVAGGFSTEVHLLDFHPSDERDLDLYDARLRLHVVRFLRKEEKFAGVDALKRQIAIDAESARVLLESEKPTPGPFGGWY
jgi:riboflavin kinase/FMN adenylyltransferase